jgi:hypothetical protein
MRRDEVGHELVKLNKERDQKAQKRGTSIYHMRIEARWRDGTACNAIDLRRSSSPSIPRRHGHVGEIEDLERVSRSTHIQAREPNTEHVHDDNITAKEGPIAGWVMLKVQRPSAMLQEDEYPCVKSEEMSG